MHPDEDGWTFGIFDKVGGAFVPGKVPTTPLQQQTAFGSPAFAGPLTATGAETFHRREGREKATLQRVAAWPSGAK